MRHYEEGASKPVCRGHLRGTRRERLTTTSLGPEYLGAELRKSKHNIGLCEKPYFVKIKAELVITLVAKVIFL